MKKWSFLFVMFAILLATTTLLEACKKADVPFTTTPVTYAIPEGFGPTKHNFAADPLTTEGIALGRHLFYEGMLSKDGQYPCASCHQQTAAFGTFDHDLSHGYNNSHTLRNAPPLFNLAWHAAFNWDSSGNNLQSLSLKHITTADEMGETESAVVAKLARSSKYRTLFKKAYGDDKVTTQRMLGAIEQFLLTLTSANSKYDRVKKGTETFTIYEQRGYEIFKAKCNTCHTEPLFTNLTYRNNGLPLTGLNDLGRMRVTGRSADSLKFKVPSLRNVALTYPYMHDGRFYTLERCLEHYNNGVVQSSTLDPSLRLGMGLSRTDLVNVVAFLNALTDSSFIKNNAFASPQ